MPLEILYLDNVQFIVNIYASGASFLLNIYNFLQFYSFHVVVTSSKVVYFKVGYVLQPLKIYLQNVNYLKLSLVILIYYIAFTDFYS